MATVLEFNVPDEIFVTIEQSNIAETIVVGVDLLINPIAIEIMLNPAANTVIIIVVTIAFCITSNVMLSFTKGKKVSLKPKIEYTKILQTTIEIIVNRVTIIIFETKIFSLLIGYEKRSITRFPVYSSITNREYMTEANIQKVAMLRAPNKETMLL